LLILEVRTIVFERETREMTVRLEQDYVMYILGKECSVACGKVLYYKYVKDKGKNNAC
jgi:hypothetical protein